MASSALQEELKLSDIRPNPNQPRTVFDEEALQELASSIKAIGIVQPITVREVEDGKYEIVAGERRFRASKMAGLETIPAYIRKVEEESVLELALIENIQREDLNAIEIAISYERLIDECNLTQDALSERVGKSERRFRITCVCWSCRPRYSWQSRNGKSVWDMPVLLLI